MGTSIRSHTTRLVVNLPATMIRTVLASLCLLLAVAASEDAAGCKSVCENGCALGLSNCHDLKEGMCEKLKTACEETCSSECSCKEGCEEKCMAEEAKCDKEGQMPLEKELCMVGVDLCKAACPPLCSGLGFRISKSLVDVRARVQKLLSEGVKLADLKFRKSSANLQALRLSRSKLLKTLKTSRKAVPLLRKSPMRLRHPKRIG